jgi:hypothetical protein
MGEIFFKAKLAAFFSHIVKEDERKVSGDVYGWPDWMQFAAG